MKVTGVIKFGIETRCSRVNRERIYLLTRVTPITDKDLVSENENPLL